MVYNVKYELVSNANFSYNNWCTSDSAAIAASIYDGYDNINYGLVIYMPIADSSQCILYGLDILELPITDKTVLIYPNPAKDNLTIETTTNTEQRLEIISLMGQTIYTNIINNKKTIINTSAFSNGVYIIKLYTDKEITVRKFVKE